LENPSSRPANRRFAAVDGEKPISLLSSLKSTSFYSDRVRNPVATTSGQLPCCRQKSPPLNPWSVTHQASILAVRSSSMVAVGGKSLLPTKSFQPKFARIRPARFRQIPSQSSITKSGAV
ncbi:hypothetical protein ACLOJK_018566, partial [Asimina triloba]